MRFKPGVHRRVHLLLAASLWTTIGLFLIVRGAALLQGQGPLWLMVLAAGLGVAKSFLVLDKTATKGVARILDFSDATCVGAVYSIRTWLLVGVMIGLGVLLRHSSLLPHYLGMIYVLVGSALLFSSRFAWQAWHRRSWQEKN